jgi:hypothetical protein
MMTNGSLLRSGGETWGPVSPDNVHETGVSPRWTVSGSWPRGRSRSSEHEERPGHESDRSFCTPPQELLKLGISVSATTIANVLRRGGLGPAPQRIGPTWGEFLRAQALAFLPTRSFVSDHQDRARHGSGPAPAAPEAPGRPPLVEGCRLDAAPGADPIGDHPEPRREEPSVLRPHGPFGTQVARRPPPSGGHPRDGPTPLTFVSTACLTTAGSRTCFGCWRTSPTCSAHTTSCPARYGRRRRSRSGRRSSRTSGPPS